MQRFIVLTVVVAIGGASDLGYVSLKGRADQLQASLTKDLQAGQSELEAGKEALKLANDKRDPKLVNQAIADFAQAKSEFESAAQEANSNRFLHYLEYVPSVGQLARSRHIAVDAIAQMGAAISDAGQKLSQNAAGVIELFRIQYDRFAATPVKTANSQKYRVTACLYTRLNI